jgi:hypothetical protein
MMITKRGGQKEIKKKYRTAAARQSGATIEMMITKKGTGSGEKKKHSHPESGSQRENRESRSREPMLKEIFSVANSLVNWVPRYELGMVARVMANGSSDINISS